MSLRQAVSRRVFRLLRLVASLHVAIALLAALIVVLACATLIEQRNGAAAARFYVYGAGWFTALGVLLAVNIAAAVAIRFPWNRRQFGFLLTHMGLLVLLLGCLATRRAGFEANLPVFEHQANWRAYKDSSRFELKVSPAPATAGAKTIDVPFESGPFSWGDYADRPWFPWRLTHRDEGVVYDRDGIRLEVLDYYADSQQIPVPWLQLRVGGPAESPDSQAMTPVALAVQSGSNHPHAAGRPFGLGLRRTLPGGQRIVFWMTGDAEETAAFRESLPDGPLGKQGRIVLHAAGRNYRFVVDGLKPNVRQPLGDSGLAVELVSFDPGFLSVRLQIHRGNAPPQTMILLADYPEFNQHDYRNGVFGTFWYDAMQRADAESGDEDDHREAAKPRIDILQGADQKLYVRGWQAPRAGAVAPLPDDGQPAIALEGTPAAATLIVDRFIPSARPDQMPVPRPFSKMKSVGQRQARVRLTVDGVTEEFWLGATVPDPGQTPPALERIVRGKERTVAIGWNPDELDLGVQVYLHKFRRKFDPGTNQPSDYSSLVDFRDRGDPRCVVRSDVLVTMNAPADFRDPTTGRSYRLFQSSFSGPTPLERLDLAWSGDDDPPNPIYVSWLTVNYDPGRGLKYFACLMIVAGIFCTYYCRCSIGPPLPPGEGRGEGAMEKTGDVGGKGLPQFPLTLTLSRSCRIGTQERGLSIGIFVAFIIILATALGAGGDAPPAPLDLSVWRRLPVLDGGRIMPLDTFARTAVTKICGDAAPTLGLGGRATAGLPTSVATKVAALFTGQKSRRFTADELLLSWLVEPDPWEYVPFLAADDPQLRTELLELPLCDSDGTRLRYASPQQVIDAVKFRERLKELVRKNGMPGVNPRPKLEGLDHKAWELYEAYSTYRLLSFQPAAPREGRERFYDKLSAAIRAWRELEEPLMRIPQLADSTAKTSESLRNLSALAHRDEEPSLDDAEPLAAALERATAQLSRLVNKWAEETSQNPSAKSERKSQRARLEAKGRAAQAADMARLAAAVRVALYDNGQELRLAPALDAFALEAERNEGDDAQPWLAVQTLLSGSDDLFHRYPQAELREARDAFRDVAAAYTHRDNPDRAERFLAATERLAASLRAWGNAVEPSRRALPIRTKDESLLALTAYPPPGSTDVEVFYNRLDPFFWAGIAAIAAVACLAVSLFVLRKAGFWLGIAGLAAAAGLIAVGFDLRVYITGWAPVTNMYESIVCVALCVALLGLWLCLWPALRQERFAEAYSRKAVVLVGGVLVVAALAAAQYVPSFPKEIRPLMPVLRSNAWLMVHVTTIMVSYGAAAMAFGLGNIALGYCLFGRYRRWPEDGAASHAPAAVAPLADTIYAILKVAVLLLLIGTVLGALWADVSWGRFWGWDSKETWALISFLAYMLVLHLRPLGWSGKFGMAFGATLAFVAILMAWYGVNFRLTGGKHSYGEVAGDAGQTSGLGLLGTLAIVAGLLYVLFLAAAAIRYLVNEWPEAEKS